MVLIGTGIVTTKNFPLFRWTLSFFLLNNLWHLYPKYVELFTDGHMVVRSSVVPWQPSLLDFWPSHWPVIIFIAAYGMFILAFGFFSHSKILTASLWVLHLSIYNFNPYIIHEPQQIASFFLFSFLFFFSQASSSARASAENIFYLKGLTYFLSAYYFSAIAKKLSDPLWIDGTAVGYILSNPAFSNSADFFQEFSPSGFFFMILTYGTLTIELGCALFIHTRFWKIATAVGVLFHFTLQYSMEIGNFAWIMLTWYAAVVEFYLADNSCKINLVKKLS